MRVERDPFHIEPTERTVLWTVEEEDVEGGSQVINREEVRK